MNEKEKHNLEMQMLHDRAIEAVEIQKTFSKLLSQYVFSTNEDIYQFQVIYGSDFVMIRRNEA